jgi:site-specific DNA recombinase
MNVVIWARVSSQEQAAEGFSIDAQLRAMRQKAEREGWKVVREFVAAESAKQGAQRLEFNKMLTWVKSNRKLQIGGILSHRLDRACRNMRDAVRLQELEQDGVRLLFVDNQFGQGAAGQLSFNVLAAVATFYSENLRSETLKGLNEKVEQGWLPTKAPYGYVNDASDRAEPIKLHQVNSRTVVRMFELYALGNHTFDSLAEKLYREGYVYLQNQPKFLRTGLSHFLHNRFYIGEIVWHGRLFKGKHRPLIDKATFEACQDVLLGRKRRVTDSALNLPLAGGLFRCKHCGCAITGELQRRKQADNSIREHVYYFCCNNNPAADHPKVRWRAEDLEAAIVADVRKLKLPSPKVTEWFRKSLRAALSDEEAYRQQSHAALVKRERELEIKKTRLLDAYLAGSVEEKVFNRKTDELKIDLERVREELGKEAKVHGDFADMATAIFDLTQRAAETWLRSSTSVRRELLDVFYSNRLLDDVSLYSEWRKPFDSLAKLPAVQLGVTEGTRTPDLLSHSQTL